MPQERDNPYPAVTKAERDKAREGVPRETQAARLLLARAVPGIPHRPYLMGECDNAPILKAVADFAAKVYTLLDELSDKGPDAMSHAEEAVRTAMKEF